MNTTPTLTKVEIIREVARATHQSQATIEGVIEAVLGEVKTALSEGYRVEFRGFGVWEVCMAKARVGRNPKYPKSSEVRIPARPVIRFRIGKHLHDLQYRRGGPQSKPTPIKRTVITTLPPAAL